MMTARDQLDILTAYQELGSYRATATLCGTTHKTVRRVLERRAGPATGRPARPHNTDIIRALIDKKVEATRGRISAKRLLPLCRAQGYTGSARSLRRAVAVAKAADRRDRRGFRPWQPVPGEHLVFDWGEEGPLKVFSNSSPSGPRSPQSAVGPRITGLRIAVAMAQQFVGPTVQLLLGVAWPSEPAEHLFGGRGRDQDQGYRDPLRKAGLGLCPAG